MSWITSSHQYAALKTRECFPDSEMRKGSLAVGTSLPDLEKTP
jgi:hypothetical protein